MAILAPLADIAEYRLDVALDASNGGMHPPQWIFCLVVIEFRDGPDRLPGTCSMAILARDIEISVGTMRAAGSLSRRAPGCPGHRQHENEVKYTRRCQHNSPLRLASATDLNY